MLLVLIPFTCSLALDLMFLLISACRHWTLSLSSIYSDGVELCVEQVEMIKSDSKQCV